MANAEKAERLEEACANGLSLVAMAALNGETGIGTRTNKLCVLFSLLPAETAA